LRPFQAIGRYKLFLKELWEVTDTPDKEVLAEVIAEMETMAAEVNQARSIQQDAVIMHKIAQELKIPV
jgi:hypothetical protein